MNLSDWKEIFKARASLLIDMFSDIQDGYYFRALGRFIGTLLVVVASFSLAGTQGVFAGILFFLLIGPPLWLLSLFIGHKIDETLHTVF